MDEEANSVKALARRGRGESWRWLLTEDEVVEKV